MKTPVRFIVLSSLVVIFFLGCSKRQTLVDQFHGTSFELAKQSQINNPQAGVADGPSTGLDGNVASKVVDRYEKGYEQKAADTNTYSVIFEGMKEK